MSQKHGARLMLLATLLAGLGWLTSKQVIAFLPPAFFLGSRFITASLLLLPLCWRELSHYTLRQTVRLLMLGVVFSTGLLLWLTAVGASDSLGEGAFIMTLSMLFAPLLHWGLFKQAPKSSFWLALPLALIGLALLSLNDGFKPSPSQLLFVIAAAMTSMHFTLNQRYSTHGAEHSTPLGRVCVQLFGVGLTASIWSLLTESGYQTLWQGFADAWPWFAASTLLATGLRFWCQLSAQSMLPASTAAVMMLMEPLWTLVLSAVWLGETLTANKLAGCVLILSALLVQRFLPESWLKRQTAFNRT